MKHSFPRNLTVRGSIIFLIDVHAKHRFSTVESWEPCSKAMRVSGFLSLSPPEKHDLPNFSTVRGTKTDWSLHRAKHESPK
jgi:hypothetical protein